MFPLTLTHLFKKKGVLPSSFIYTHTYTLLTGGKLQVYFPALLYILMLILYPLLVEYRCAPYPPIPTYTYTLLNITKSRVCSLVILHILILYSTYY